MLRSGSFEARAVGGRVLIVLTAPLIAVSPWTEYYWHFDNFLRGGQDFEFGLLATILVCCLALVLMQHSKQSVSLSFTLRRWLSILFQYPRTASPKLPFRLVAAFHVEFTLDTALGIFDLPLRI
jgi:hypothetical protein